MPLEEGGLADVEVAIVGDGLVCCWKIFNPATLPIINTIQTNTDNIENNVVITETNESLLSDENLQYKYDIYSPKKDENYLENLQSSENYEENVQSGI